MRDIVLSVRDLHVNFNVHQGKQWPWSAPQKLHAVNGVSFELERGKTLGVVGESGCGKSTLIRAICGLEVPNAGEVFLDGKAVDYRNHNALTIARRKMQMIFQDPIASLNPRMTVAEIIDEPLHIMFPSMSVQERKNKTLMMLDRVGIAKRNLGRYPHEFSGGQCQRIGIARALVGEPELLLCDEPVSALDVSIQAQVMNLLGALQREMGLTMIFVAHDLSIVRHISENILVMYLGRAVEHAEAEDLCKAPLHPYSQALLSAVPIADPKRQIKPQLLVGDLPSPLDLPNGCLFSTRCPEASSECYLSRPDQINIKNHVVSCFKVR